MIGRRKIALEFPVNWLLIVPIVGLGLLVAFLKSPESWHPGLIFGAAVLGGSAALTTAINALDARVSQGQQVKVTAALQFLDKWNDPGFFSMKKGAKEVIDEFKKLKRVEEQKAYLEADVSRQANLFCVLNLFESMAIAIKKEMVDDETARLFFRSILAEYWHNTDDVIRKRRAERDNVRLFREFEWLYNQWKGKD